MPAENDITGHLLKSKKPSEDFNKGWDYLLKSSPRSYQDTNAEERKCTSCRKMYLGDIGRSHCNECK